MKVLLVFAVFSILLMLGSVSCGAETRESTDTTTTEEASTNYEINVLVENQIVLVEAIFYGEYNAQTLAAGIKKVAETYMIREVVPIAGKYTYGSPTAAVILMVEPLR